jgi:hypothetical protein
VYSAVAVERGRTIKADPIQLERPENPAPALPVTSVWRTIRGFILWSYERGSVQYDVMVTIILLFVFLSPRFINFNDRPIGNPLSTGVVVYPDANGGFIYQIDAKAVSGTSDQSAIRGQLLRVIEPISGEVTITKYEGVTDRKGHVIAYKVWAEK